MESLWLIPALLLGGFVFVFGILRRFNDWYYIGRLGKKQYPLPPGDMGWPYLGGILTFLKAFRSGDPDSYIHNLVSKSLSLSLTHTGTHIPAQVLHQTYLETCIGNFLNNILD